MLRVTAGFVLVAACSGGPHSSHAGHGAPDAGGSDGGGTSGNGASGQGGASGCACPNDAPGQWRSINTAGASGSQLLWTGTELLTFDGIAAHAASLYSPCSDSWRAAPALPKNAYTATVEVEQQSQFLFFTSPSASPASFYSFDYASDRVSMLTLQGAPHAQDLAILPTASGLIAWGGAIPRPSPDIDLDGTNEGATYDVPAAAWRAITTQGAPSKRVAPAAWTGSQLVVWGGHSGDGQCATNYTDVSSNCTVFGDGAVYDPAHDSWTKINDSGAPTARFDHFVAWTRKHVLVWGGGTQGSMDRTLFTPPKQWLSGGASYDLATNSWKPTAQSPAPLASHYLAGYWQLWTGTRLAVGPNGGAQGWLFDPESNQWTDLPAPAADNDAGPGYCERGVPLAQAGALVMLCEVRGSRSVLLLAPDATSWSVYALPAGTGMQPNVLWTGKRLFVLGGIAMPASGCGNAPPGVGCDPLPPVPSTTGFTLVP